MHYSAVVFSGDCHTKPRRETVNSPAVKNGLGHGLEKWSYQRPAEAPPSPVDDGWKRRLSLPVVQLGKLHEAAGYL